MINLEQVKLLETKVAKAIDWIERLSSENTGLRQKEAELQTKLETCQKRNDELEVLIKRFREDQGIMEDAILTALDRFNQFEESIEKSLKDKPDAVINPGTNVAAKESSGEAGFGDGKINFEIPLSSTETNEPVIYLGTEPENARDDDIDDPLEPLESLSPAESLDDSLEPLTKTDSSAQKNGELDIF